MSLVALFVMPFMGSAAGLKFKVPNTWAGWMVFTVTNLITAVLSVMIFHCFIKQAKVNVRDNPRFLEAQKILDLLKIEEFNPRDPHKFLKQQYSRKGVTVFISSLTAMIGLSNAILRFDLPTLLSFVAVVINSIVFGLIEMNVVEDYWTEEYWFYAKKIEKKLIKEGKYKPEEEDQQLQMEELI